jgi:hypothetical protein
MKIEMEITKEQYREILETLIHKQGCLWILDLIQKGIKQTEKKLEVEK